MVIWIHKNITMPTAYHVDYHYKYIGFALLTTSRFDSGYYNIIFPRKVTLTKFNNSKSIYYKYNIKFGQPFEHVQLERLLSEGYISYV